MPSRAPGATRPVLVAAVLALAGCGAEPEPAQPEPGPTPEIPVAEERRYRDPFAYCRAVGTVDAPDARWIGPALPQQVRDGLVDLGLVAGDAPASIRLNAAWRCLDGELLVCSFGANIPCREKADTRRAPTAAMREWCAEHPESEFIPMAATGHATVFEWACRKGEPVVERQIVEPDARGFLSNVWYPLDSDEG